MSAEVRFEDQKPNRVQLGYIEWRAKKKKMKGKKRAPKKNALQKKKGALKKKKWRAVEGRRKKKRPSEKEGRFPKKKENGRLKGTEKKGMF